MTVSKAFMKNKPKTLAFVEPGVSAKRLIKALPEESIELFRPLLPVGYQEGVRAYRASIETLNIENLSSHYTQGQTFFSQEFIPYVKRLLSQLSGGVWDFTEFEAYGAGSDVDLMSHIVEAVAAYQPVRLFPGDWFGFLVGCTQEKNIQFSQESTHSLACLCVPSVRNGHMAEECFRFLENADACLLNLNLYPTLLPEERIEIANSLLGVWKKSLFSISFSRGFGLTASQLGVLLVHKDHPLRQKFDRQWSWFRYFYNQIAARAFMRFSFDEIEKIDTARRQWVHSWLEERNLPVVNTGAYYVKSFRPEGVLPKYFSPLLRENVLRLCFKPPQS